MAGGEREAVARLEPLLKELAVPGGYVHAGGPGAGHFVKLVHNGIEFGMLQAIAEGVDLLDHYREALPVGEVLECWRHGSVVRSWLIDLMARSYRESGGLGNVPAHVEDTGEVNWLVTDALLMERPIPVIAQAVMQLLASRDGDRDWAAASPSCAPASAVTRSAPTPRCGASGSRAGSATSAARRRRSDFREQVG